MACGARAASARRHATAARPPDASTGFSRCLAAATVTSPGAGHGRAQPQEPGTYVRHRRGVGGAYVRATRRGYSCSSSCGFSPTARVVCGLACADTLVHGTRLHVLDEWRVRRVDQVLGVEGGRVLRYYAILWNMCGSDHVSDLFSF